MLGAVPFVGWAFSLLFFVLGLGALATGLWAHRRRTRTATTASPADEPAAE